MNNHERVDLGIRGENLAEEYLRDLGYSIEGRNEMIGHSDIDILARNGEVLVFVEVRTRSRGERVTPEETLTEGKLKRMRKTAELYMAVRRYGGPARLDGVCILLPPLGEISHFRHYKGVG